tara:strand:+ start:2998 stop:3228 length:231 start_codon:yes stop_codon:yes gene_type:complete
MGQKRNLFRYSIRSKGPETIEFIKNWLTKSLDENESHFTYTQKVEDEGKFILIESSEDVLLKILRKNLIADINILD